MGQFSYEAYTKQGKKTKGVVEAHSIADAREKVREMALLPTAIGPQKKGKSGIRLRKDQLIVFTGQLAQLLSAKIPLYESLIALEEQSREEPFHPVLVAICERIKSGISLSLAMNEFDASFPPIYRALIAAGEAVGGLELATSRLHLLLSHQNRVHKSLVSAMMYPALLSALLIVAIFVLSGFVIPSLKMLFDGKEVPQFTKVVFAISEFLEHWGLPLLFGLACFGFFSWRRLKSEANRARMQRQLLRVPLVNRYIVLSALARFARTLATLLDGGMQLANALGFARKALQNARLEEIVSGVEEKIIEGKSFSQAAARYKEIPPLFSRMVQIGEESGKLSSMLTQLASLYEEETERVMNRLVSLAQPILLLIMGGIIGTVLLSILLPLTSFGSSMEL